MPGTNPTKAFGSIIPVTPRDMHARHPLNQQWTNKSDANPYYVHDRNK